MMEPLFPVIKEDIVNLMKTKHKIHPEDTRAVGYFDLYEQYNRVESLFGAMSFIAYFVGILVLLSGIIGVSNIMLIVVKERTKEIGIRRALGEDPWSIKKQILIGVNFSYNYIRYGRNYYWSFIYLWC